MTSRSASLLALALGLAGCSHSGNNTSTPAGNVASTNPAPDPSGSPTAAPAGTPPTPVTLPDDLKNDAYAYYGLAVDKPLKAELKVNGTSYSGVHTLKLESVKGDTATYEETQTGTPQGDQSQTVSLTPEGIFIESVGPYTLKTPHVLQLPTKLPPGATWKTHMEIDLGTTSLKQDTTDRVVGIQKLHTSSGDVDALYVTGVGTGTLDTKPITTKEEWWYERGKGLAKQIETVTRDGKTQTVETVLEG